jgi:hypothetical protein
MRLKFEVIVPRQERGVDDARTNEDAGVVQLPSRLIRVLVKELCE